MSPFRTQRTNRSGRGRRALRPGTCWLLAPLLLASPALAYEDADCQRFETVPISVDEDAPSWGEVDLARARAQDRTAQLAILQVIGINVESERENKEQIDNDKVDQRFRQMEKSALKGLVRVAILAEAREPGPNGVRVSLRSNVTVCIPKPEVLRKAEREREGRPPQPVDPAKTNWFDPVSGQPRVWYGRGETGMLEFFDNSGFHPRTGEKLVAVDRKVVAEWRLAAQREARDAAERAQREQARREAEAERQARSGQAVGTCDRLAAGVYDPDKPAGLAGAPLLALRENAEEAAVACEAAVQQAPDERRYRYQLARAYQAKDPKRAMPILAALMKQNYRAAFDNHGWALLDVRVGRNDLRGAIESFRKGAALGDPDAMHSLASLIAKGRAEPRTADEGLRLYKRAAELGHQEAGAAMQALADEQRRAEAQRLQNEQAARAMMGIFGGVLGGAVRR